MNNSYIISPESLAYWYFRLNGCFTIPNFIVHPDRGVGQKTDVDILAVRFPYRAELLENSMVDDEAITSITRKPLIIIAEVKTARCRLNGPWVRKGARNMQRIFRAVGAFPFGETELVAESIYKKGVYENESYYITLVCVGKTINNGVMRDYPAVPQLTWDDILSFIYNRFNTYIEQKRYHSQWDKVGQLLWDSFTASNDVNEFKEITVLEE